jgi:predicted RNA-binding Zn-ribbon protein involved in translation (DUF1610 family)
MSRLGKTIVHAAIGAVVALIVVYPVAAGTGYSLKCSECGFDAFIVLASGGLDGRLGHETVAVGYCCTCDQMVSVSYTAKTPEDEREKLKQPLGTVFCFDNGKRYTLYACPTCGKPFIAMSTGRIGLGKPPADADAARGDAANAGAKLFCPKCGKQTLETSTRRIME